MNIKLNKRVFHDPVKHFQYTFEPTESNPLQVSFLYLEFDVFEVGTQDIKKESSIKAEKMDVGGAFSKDEGEHRNKSSDVSTKTSATRTGKST